MWPTPAAITGRGCHQKGAWGGMGEGILPQETLLRPQGPTHLSGSGPRPGPTTDWQLEVGGLSGSSGAGRQRGRSQ